MSAVVTPVLRVVCVVSFLVWAFGSEGQAGELRATPYRPTVSNPAYLPIPGYLQWEAGVGVLKAKSEEARRRARGRID